MDCSKASSAKLTLTELDVLFASLKVKASALPPLVIEVNEQSNLIPVIVPKSFNLGKLNPMVADPFDAAILLPFSKSPSYKLESLTAGG